MKVFGGEECVSQYKFLIYDIMMLSEWYRPHKTIKRSKTWEIKNAFIIKNMCKYSKQLLLK